MVTTIQEKKESLIAKTLDMARLVESEPSLEFALERLGCRPRLSADAGSISRATHVILPGVGAAVDAMARAGGHGPLGSTAIIEYYISP